MPSVVVAVSTTVDSTDKQDVRMRIFVCATATVRKSVGMSGCV